MKQITALTCMVVLLAASRIASAATTEVVARDGAVSVSDADITALVGSLPADARARLKADPSQLDGLVKGQITDRLVLQEAESKGWGNRAQVQAALEVARRDIIIRIYLASLGEPPASYPDDQQIAAAYAQDRAALTVPRSLHLQQIFIPAPATADAATVARAQQKADQVAKAVEAPGADFGAIAATASQDVASAQRHGDLGFVAENNLLPPVRAAVNTLKPGGIAGPIRTPAGFHIVRLVEVREAYVRPLAEVQPAIRAALRTQKQREAIASYLAGLAKPGDVKIDEPALARAFAAAH
jgi:peptidylprolyl isomerase